MANGQLEDLIQLLEAVSASCASILEDIRRSTSFSVLIADLRSEIALAIKDLRKADEIAELIQHESAK